MRGHRCSTFGFPLCLATKLLFTSHRFYREMVRKSRVSDSVSPEKQQTSKRLLLRVFKLAGPSSTSAFFIRLFSSMLGRNNTKRVQMLLYYLFENLIVYTNVFFVTFGGLPSQRLGKKSLKEHTTKSVMQLALLLVVPAAKTAVPGSCIRYFLQAKICFPFTYM